MKTKFEAWRDARAVEWDGLENRCMGNCTEGSNPSLSALSLRSFSEGGLVYRSASVASDFAKVSSDN